MSTERVVNKPKLWRIITAVVVVAVLAAIVAFSYTFKVGGQVTDISTKQPVAGVVVDVSGHKSTTDNSGNYSVTGIKFYEQGPLKITPPVSYTSHSGIAISYKNQNITNKFTVEPTLKTTVEREFAAQQNLQYDYMWSFMHPASQVYWGNQQTYTDIMKKIETYLQNQNISSKDWKINGAIRTLDKWKDPITGKSYKNVHEVPASYTSITDGVSNPKTQLYYYQEVNGFFHYFTATDKNQAQQIIKDINIVNS